MDLLPGKFRGFRGQDAVITVLPEGDEVSSHVDEVSNTGSWIRRRQSMQNRVTSSDTLLLTVLAFSALKNQESSHVQPPFHTILRLAFQTQISLPQFSRGGARRKRKRQDFNKILRCPSILVVVRLRVLYHVLFKISVFWRNACVILSAGVGVLDKPTLIIAIYASALPSPISSQAYVWLKGFAPAW